MRKLILKSTVNSLFIFIAVSCGSNAEESESSDGDIKESTEDIFTAGNETVEKLSSTFIFALQTAEYKIVEQYLPSVDDFKDIMTNYDGDDQKKKDIIADSEETSEKIAENTQKAFEDIIDLGEEAGITWSEVEYSSSEIEYNPENNLEYAEVTIAFVSNDLEYKIYISECINSSRGWLIFDKPKWIG